MPSQIIHLAIAKRYLVKHHGVIKNVQLFMDGNVLPDLGADKSVSHCGVRTETHDLIKRNREKVNPQKFSREHDMTDDLNRGQYLHLLVDDAFYNDLLHDYFTTVDMEQSSIDMYETTCRDEAFLMQKYHVKHQDSTYATELVGLSRAWDQDHARRRAKQGEQYHYVIPYDLSTLVEFVEKMSDVQFPD